VFNKINISTRHGTIGIIEACFLVAIPRNISIPENNINDLIQNK